MPLITPSPKKNRDTYLAFNFPWLVPLFLLCGRFFGLPFNPFKSQELTREIGLQRALVLYRIGLACPLPKARLPPPPHGR